MSKPQTMEVHHHSHPPTSSKRKWTHYLWEFIMLFLAVFCGFLAENQREHIVEHNRERQYVISICRDLESDTNQLNGITKFRNGAVVKIDSLLYYLNMHDPDRYGSSIYYYARWLTNQTFFLSNDRTIQQLKNAGNLRLIRDQLASDSIMSYDWEVRRNGIRIEREQTYINDYVNVLKEIFDGNEFDKMIHTIPDLPILDWQMPKDNPHLLHKDKESIQRLINSVHFLKSINLFNIGWNSIMKHRASGLSQFLKTEYHLQ